MCCSYPAFLSAARHCPGNRSLCLSRLSSCSEVRAPRPAGAWWAATGATEAREQAAARRGYAPEFDVGTYFLHDVPEDVLRAGPEQPREEAEIVFGEPCRFEHWPDIPIHGLAGRDDRFFPIEF